MAHVHSTSKKKGADKLTMEEIDAGIAAARRERDPRPGQ
jgi:hypothetical protein